MAARGAVRRARGALVLAAAAVAAGCAGAEAAEVGSAAPRYEARTLDGGTVSLAELRGEVVLLNVWATWCWPCRREMPSLEALQRDYGEAGLRVVAVSVDGAGDADEVRAFAAEHAPSLTVLHDPGQRIAQVFRTRGLPETFLIGRDGVVLRHWIGRVDGHAPGIRDPVREALAGRGG